MRILFIVLLCVMHAALRAQSPISLRDISKETGIKFVHTDGSSGRRYIVETVSAGLATFDYDGDGKIDILFLNGSPLPGTPTPPSPPRNALYRNEGGWKFTDVTVEAGLGDTNYHLGVCIGDYDNDGDPDIYLNNFGPNVLYRNEGNGTFLDVTPEAGVAGAPETVGAGACFMDIDADGDLDLFVANYIAFTFENHKISHMNGYPAYAGPLQFPPSANVLYRNNGNGTFTDISVESGIAKLLGSGMGAVAGDYDNDGDADIFIGNDLRPNFLLQNDGTGKFREVAGVVGVAYDSTGNVQGSMGVEFMDFNHDGWLDVFITPYQRQLVTLYQNQKGSFFDEVGRKTGAASGTFSQVKWGTGLIDFDNDGHRDIFVACGHLIDNVDLFDTGTSYEARNIVLRNTGGSSFVNVSDRCGDGLLPKLSSRGAAFDDLDNDGDVDVVVLNSRREPTILRNDSARTNQWLQIELRGTKTNRDGVGARVTVKAGDLKQIDEVHSGRSYQSNFGKRLSFGLGPRKNADEVQVKWLGGGVDLVRNVRANQLITVIEGQGVAGPQTKVP